MRVAVVQMAAPWGSVEEMRARTVRLLEAAADAGAALAVLPEVCTASYDFTARSDLTAAAEPLDGPTVRAWTAVAARTGLYVAGGLPERDGPRLYNTAVLLGPDGVIGRYRKAHLFHYERGLFEPGDLGFPVWDTPVGRLGMLVCYDLRFAEAVRVVFLRGAQVLCVPTTWTDRGKPEPWDARGWCGANYLAAGHAYANRLWVACADRAGRDGGVTTLGCSAIFAPSGYAAAGPASPDREEILYADVDVRRPDGARATGEMDLVRDRRPELYGDLIREEAPWNSG